MNKKILFSILILIVLAGGGFFVYQMMTKNSVPVETQNVVSNTNQNETKTDDGKVLREAILKVEKGEASLQRGEDIQTITTSAVLTEGDMITTKKDATAMIVFADSSIVRLKENTEVYLSAINISDEGKQIDMIQTFGETWHKVNELMKGDRYTVRNSNTIVGVRGTVFDLLIPDKQKLTVSVLSHSVEVVDTTTKQSETVQEKNALLYDEAKTKFVVSPKLYEDLSASAWFAENKKADDQIDQLQQTNPHLFDYYVKKENLQLLPDTVPPLKINPLPRGINWWEDPLYHQQLPAEYLQQMEAGLRAYEEFLRTVGNMNFNWQEYEDALNTIKNMNLNISIPPDVYKSLDQLKNMNYTVPTIPDTTNLQVPTLPPPSSSTSS